MKRIIDIPEADFEFIKNLTFIGGLRGNTKTIQSNVINAIRNSKPYEEPEGEWITEYDRMKCPFCGMSIDDEVHWLYLEGYNFNFCPNCGADMRGTEK